MPLTKYTCTLWAAFAVIPTMSAQNQFCLGPSVAASNADLKWTTDGILDAPLVTYTSANKRYFIAHGAVDGEGRIHKVSGSLSRPIEYRVWPGPKTQERLFPSANIPVRVNGLDYRTSLWIQSVYQDPGSGGLLAFLHVEAYAEPPQPANGNEFAMRKWVGRVGLAWSSDGGETFSFLGHIVKPYSPSEPRLETKMYYHNSQQIGTGIDIANVQGVQSPG